MKSIGIMNLNMEVQQTDLVYGMRRGIPAARMEQIHAGLPRSYDLQNLTPCLANPLVELDSGHKKIRARVRLSQGWHLLNEARTALIEAEACKVFYEECESNSLEAVYHCRFYLDDAALRLYSSCEHLLRCIIFNWNLSLSKKSRAPLLAKVIETAEQSSEPQVSGDVAAGLRRLTTDWEECKKYRDDWVHNERPAIHGLDWEILFKTWDEKDIPPVIRKALGFPASGKMISVGTGRNISELHRIVRNSYCQLFGVYERLAPLVA